ncbi:32726_t:CDS:1, partial [Racocetra persica]
PDTYKDTMPSTIPFASTSNNSYSDSNNLAMPNNYLDFLDSSN